LVLGRNFLHAAHLEFSHPRTRKLVTLDAPLPPELEAYLARLESAGPSLQQEKRAGGRGQSVSPAEAEAAAEAEASQGVEARRTDSVSGSKSAIGVKTAPAGKSASGRKSTSGAAAPAGKVRRVKKTGGD
jgi:hypothetical protein